MVMYRVVQWADHSSCYHIGIYETLEEAIEMADEVYEDEGGTHYTVVLETGFGDYREEIVYEVER